MTDVILGDCVTVMATMDDDSFDAIVTDPPYGLEFMGRTWDKLGAGVEQFAPSDFGSVDGNSFGQPGGQHVRYGKSAKTMQTWHETWAREAYRVAKPRRTDGDRAVIESAHVRRSGLRISATLLSSRATNIDSSGEPPSLTAGGFSLPGEERSMGPRRRSRPARDQHRVSGSARLIPRTRSRPPGRRYAARIHRWHPSPLELRQRAYRDTAYRTPPSLVRAECAPLPAPAWWNV